MSQVFTEKDLPKLKSRLTSILSLIYDGLFDFVKFQSLGLISVEQAAVARLKVRMEYPGIVYDPVPKELRPLLVIVQYLVKEEKTQLKPAINKIKPKPQYPWDRTASYAWDDYWADPWSGPRYH